MFDFQTYVGFLITIIVCNISLTTPLHNQQDRLDISQYTESSKIDKSINRINILTLFLIVIITLLNFFYDIKHFFVTIVFPFFKNWASAIGSFFKKTINAIPSFLLLFRNIVPFKEGFFSDDNFRFSYITETVLMTIIVLILIYFIFGEACIDLWNYFISIIISIGIGIGLIWLNVFLSNTLCSHFSNHFIIKSLILNIVAYLIIGVIVLIISLLFYELFDYLHPKKILTQQEMEYKLKQLREQRLSQNNTTLSDNSSINLKKEESQNTGTSEKDRILLEKHLNELDKRKK